MATQASAREAALQDEISRLCAVVGALEAERELLQGADAAAGKVGDRSTCFLFCCHDCLLVAVQNMCLTMTVCHAKAHCCLQGDVPCGSLEGAR